MGVADNEVETTKLNSKISSEQDAINAVMKQIGEFYYNKYLESKKADAGIKEFCAAIDGHNAAIAEAKAEIKRIKTKKTAPAPGAGLEARVCPACGKAVPPDMKFCGECGAKMPVPAPAPAPSGGPVCPACGKENLPGAKFCTGCGGKLGAGKRVCACGAEIVPGMKFCTGCGAKLE